MKRFKRSRKKFKKNQWCFQMSALTTTRQLLQQQKFRWVISDESSLIDKNDSELWIIEINSASFAETRKTAKCNLSENDISRDANNKDFSSQRNWYNSRSRTRLSILERILELAGSLAPPNPSYYKRLIKNPKKSSPKIIYGMEISDFHQNKIKFLNKYKTMQDSWMPAEKVL